MLGVTIKYPKLNNQGSTPIANRSLHIVNVVISKTSHWLAVHGDCISPFSHPIPTVPPGGNYLIVHPQYGPIRCYGVPGDSSPTDPNPPNTPAIAPSLPRQPILDSPGQSVRFIPISEAQDPSSDGQPRQYQYRNRPRWQPWALRFSSKSPFLLTGKG